MANYVINRINVKGNREDIANFLQKCATKSNGEKSF